MNEKSVRDLVRAWVHGVIGIETIHGWPNKDAPPEPYAVLLLSMSDTVHEQPADMDFVGEDVEAEDGELIAMARQIPLGETYWRFSIDVFGTDPENYLRKIKIAHEVPTAMWPLEPLILFDTTRIMTANEIRDQEWKGRANMTIEVRGVLADGLLVNVIDEAAVELTRIEPEPA